MPSQVRALSQDVKQLLDAGAKGVVVLAHSGTATPPSLHPNASEGLRLSSTGGLLPATLECPSLQPFVSHIQKALPSSSFKFIADPLSADDGLEGAVQSLRNNTADAAKVILVENVLRLEEERAGLAAFAHTRNRLHLPHATGVEWLDSVNVADWSPQQVGLWIRMQCPGIVALERWNGYRRCAAAYGINGAKLLKMDTNGFMRLGALPSHAELLVGALSRAQARAAAEQVVGAESVAKYVSKPKLGPISRAVAPAAEGSAAPTTESKEKGEGEEKKADAGAEQEDSVGEDGQEAAPAPTPSQSSPAALAWGEEELSNLRKLQIREAALRGLLSRSVDVYVNDAISTLHNNTPSVVGVAPRAGVPSLMAKDAPAASKTKDGKGLRLPGPALAKGLAAWSQVFTMKAPRQSPVCAIVGGSDVVDKLDTALNLCEFVDNLVLGGVPAVAWAHVMHGMPLGAMTLPNVGELALKVRRLAGLAQQRGVKLFAAKDFVVGKEHWRAVKQRRDAEEAEEESEEEEEVDSDDEDAKTAKADAEKKKKEEEEKAQASEEGASPEQRAIDERAKAELEVGSVPPGDSYVEPLEFDYELPVREVKVADGPGDDQWIMDIGSGTREVVGEIVERAKILIWTGPLGVAEVAEFAAGTQELIETVGSCKEQGLVSIAGKAIPPLDSTQFHFLSFVVVAAAVLLFALAVSLLSSCTAGTCTSAYAYFMTNASREEDTGFTHVAGGGPAVRKLLKGQFLPGVSVMSKKP